MSHLTLETLARLLDEPPDGLEAAHLAACDMCRAEFDALRADIASLAVLAPLAPPDAVWHRIERRARAEGLIRTTTQDTHSWGAPLMRLAASVLVFAVGAASGIAWTRSEAAIAGDGLSPTQPGVAEASITPLVDLGTTFLTARRPSTTAEAAQLVDEAQTVLYYALTRAADFEPVGTRDEMLARLATLESITTVTGTALNHAPADPVINGYYLSALAQRDATLRHVSVANVSSW